MQRLPLLKILEKLGVEDWKRLRIHLKKTYPKKQIALNILDALKAYYPNFNSPKLNREKLYKKIFPGKDFNYKQLQNQLIDLKGLVLEFIRQDTLKKESFEKDILLLKAYQRYKLDDFFYQQLEGLEEKLEQEEQDSAQLWLAKMQLSHEHYYYPSTDRMTKAPPSIYQAMSHLDIFYAISKLRYACEYINRKNILNVEIPKIALLTEIQKIPGIEKVLLFQLYQAMLTNLMDINQENYPALKSFLLDNLHKIEKDDQLILFSSLFNLLSSFMKAGSSQHQKEMMDLLESGIEGEVFFVNGYFDAEFFITIVDHACKLQRYKWVRQFIELKKYQLEGIKQESVVALSEALILYAEKDYMAILPKLCNIKGTNIHHELRLRLLQIVSAYEMKNHDSLNAFITSFDRYARRNNTIHPNTQKAVLNFLSIVRKLIKNNADQTKLLEEMKRKKFFLFRLWLKKKIEDKASP